ncbi:putative lipid II flippase FtsW [Cellulomonas wangsupingiae]|uniref:Probable peptidoglycan glycosyltransferase FtsW n=1 Tax=Cellulomonas wangsupingiae TaxID=2968085 RepID=A0ABY5KAZ4_9CELL|nr:putative lipid II flippase FtsW [Cellulomonas wangsupingiae]MCC2335195.1 putative lipid II flippase FtsW [Cellulomonas wangsupingiae]MCM0639185.1 putative lipid II flippase FtsW [Cellulomonas wangsupingiae]UUI66999.1 putative lipid II flippase FtsW [Cellulomonas wangsupingiae]
MTPPGGTPEVREPSLLGTWNSAVTSYYVLLGATLLLVAIGLVMVLSSSSVESLAAGKSPYAVFFDQTRYALVGLPALVVMSRLPVRVLKALAWPALAGAIAFQMLVFVPGLGCGAGGNRNWVCLPGFSAQPSEAVKLALAIWLGAVLARKLRLLHEWKHALVPAVPVAGVAIGVVLLGKDLGTAMVLVVLVAGAMFVAGVPLRIFAVAGAVAAAGVALLAIDSENRMTRITAWLSAECDVTNECYQTLHAGWGLATGGWSGVGLGQSAEKWSYLPAAHNDFIYAILGEELGFVGTVLVLALFALLAFAMIRIMRRHPDPFVKIATAAVFAWVIGQAMINIAVVIGLLPVIGVPLPLVSAGGSALIMTMAALGMLLAFARTEPGAAEALSARASVVRRSLAVIGRTRG